MDTDRGLVLVTGATGRQGGAAARRLLGMGFRVRALTRDANRPAAYALEELGAEMVEGDLNDPASLERAIEGARGVFGVQNFWEHGYQAEVQQGKNLADVALAAGIQHIVYSSVGGAERHSGIPHFESKWEIEQYIVELGLPATILRPVYFYENWRRGSNLRMEGGTAVIRMGVPPDAPLQMIAVDDIGEFVALAFGDPDRWIGQALEIAGDELTIPQLAEEIQQVTGVTTRFEEIPLDQVRQESEERARMLEWFAKGGFGADIPALREIHPGLLRFEDWLRVTGWTPGKPLRRAAAQRAAR